MMSSNNGARSSASGGMAAADDEALELLSSIQASTMAAWSHCDILQQVNRDDSLVCQMAEDGDGCTWE